ncbi:MAG: hypothetical protein DRQ88_08400 [Epsilonproteobacteria bacterium]|nr:MAG: hypothetical protein DRQ89_10885 [Campylobacterota bacterium]RLA65949.1 MAG: hypothetical protein DRQ88_08400 [Campylobacterota bacterium]
MKILILFILFSSSLFGREPAIEPIFGLSIDEISEISPKDARGFNFSGTSTENTVVLPRSDFNGLIMLLSLLIVTPTILMVSLGIAKKKEMKRLQKDKDFILILEDYRKEKEDKIKKAS